MRRFVVCIHDATPAYARETHALLRDFAPLIGRRLSCGVVPDWHGAWPLAAHRDYCRLVSESSDELLLHGYFHQRRRGRGPVTWLTERSDEMNGLDAAATRCAIERGQRVFTHVFGAPARGFLPPAWQAGHVREVIARTPGGVAAVITPTDVPRSRGNDAELEDGASSLEFVAGFSSLDAAAGRRVPLATWTWDCGRWGWLGHVGHGIGALLQSLAGRVPVLAIHPADAERGFRPKILRLAQRLLDAGYEPDTLAGVLDVSVRGERW